ncbi:MAG: portal protein, partial [Gammaproteobacteria bacterium]
KIPYSRFMYEDGGGEFNLAADGMIRDEIKFGKFIKRLRSTFQEILVKPMYIQMCLKYPEFTNDPQFRTQVALRFNEENVFAELKTMEIMEKRLEFIGNMRDSLMTTNQETMEEEYYFDQEYLVKKYLKLSDDEIRGNEAAKAKQKKEEAEEPAPEDDGMGF